MVRRQKKRRRRRARQTMAGTSGRSGAGRDVPFLTTKDFGIDRGWGGAWNRVIILVGYVLLVQR